MTENDSPADLPAITAAEFLSTREFLGLSTRWISERMVIDERAIVRIEAGQNQSPTVLVTLLDDIYAETRETLDRMVGTYRRKLKTAGGEPVILTTYRTDPEYAAAGGKYPSRWHRHLCARVADAVPGVIVMFRDPGDIFGVNIGERFTGVVTNTTDFGAFVALRPGLDGLIHVSKFASGTRVDNVEDYVVRGDIVDVEVIDVNSVGKVSLRLVGDNEAEGLEGDA